MVNMKGEVLCGTWDWACANFGNLDRDKVGICRNFRHMDFGFPREKEFGARYRFHAHVKIIYWELVGFCESFFKLISWFSLRRFVCDLEIGIPGQYIWISP